MKNYFIAIVLILLVGFAIYYELKPGKTGVSHENQQTSSVLNNSNSESTVVSQTDQEKPVSQGLSISLTSPQDKITVSSSTVTVAGQISPGADVFVNEKEMKADSLGKFSTNYSLLEGENDIYISVNDDSGNYAEKMVTVYLESTQ